MNLILPQLAAPGIDIRVVRKETEWNCKFGPVYARAIPEYVAKGCNKTSEMRHARWPLVNRLDVGIGVSFPMFLVILIIMAVFLRAWLVEFVVLGWGLTILMCGLYPLIPGRVGWHKLIFLEVLIGVGLLAYVFFDGGQVPYIRGLFFMTSGLVALIGIDFGGATPFEKSQLDPLLDKLGIRGIGPMGFRGRAKIVGSKMVLDQTKCNGCGICYDVCPRGAFDIENDDHKRVVIRNSSICGACEACVRQCPEEALYLSD